MSQLSKKARTQLDNQHRKDRDMYNDFYKLSNKKMHGVPMLTTEAILKQLEQDYYLNEVTIMRRLKRYAQSLDTDKNQLKMDLPEED